jgi:hypothetical protein
MPTTNRSAIKSSERTDYKQIIPKEEQARVISELDTLLTHFHYKHDGKVIHLGSGANSCIMNPVPNTIAEKYIGCSIASIAIAYASLTDRTIRWDNERGN